MRHRKKFNHLSRQSSHRKAMLANMASSLIVNKRITTTTAKAKALRVFVEPLITRSKEDTTHSRRMVFRHLRDKEAVTELFREVSGKVGEREGGYTRIIKLGNRLGDNADMCMIELVDFNDNLIKDKATEKAKTSRRRRGGKKKSEDGEGTETLAQIPLEIAPEAEVAEPEAKAEEPASEAEVAKPEAKAGETAPEAEVAEPEAKAEEIAPEAEVAEPEAKAEEIAPEAEESSDKEPKKE